MQTGQHILEHTSLLKHARALERPHETQVGDLMRLHAGYRT
jgi:hypothetical protein